MDHRSFDRLARMLGEATDRRAGLRALIGGLLGAGGVSAIDAEARRGRNDRGPDRRDGKDNGGDKDQDTGRKDASGPAADKRKKRKKKCKPACEGGFSCVKGQCVCPSGIECGGACCASGKACVNGACASQPGPTPDCIAGGEPCKNVGRSCCDGRVCSSGQGGDRDIACYVPKTGRCERTSDCVYGMSCQDGRCAPPAPGSLAAPCDSASQQLCTTPGAVCTPYDGAGAPNGAHCTLPLESACAGDAECTCYKCWYVNPGAAGSGRAGREERDVPRFACCGPSGYTCQSDRNCCLGLSCVNGICGDPNSGGGGGGGTVCVPDDAPGCDIARCCSDRAICRKNTCKLAIPTGEACTTAADELPCAEAPDASCRAGDVESQLRCRLDAGGACDGPEDCVTDDCGDGRCKARTTEACGTSNNGAACRESHDECVNAGTEAEPAFECRSKAGIACTGDADCISGTCSTGTSGKVCDALTEEACGASNAGAQCRERTTTDICHDTGTGGWICLRDAGVTCTGDGQCISTACGGTAPNQVCKALTGETCGSDNHAAICLLEDTTDDCRASYSDPTGETHCLRAVGVACEAATDCYSGGCENDRCTAVTTETCGGSPEVTCQVADDTCFDTGAGKKCLREAGTDCGADAQCISGVCGANGVCTALNREKCGASNNGAICKEAAGDCRRPYGQTTGDTVCLRDAGDSCSVAGDCYSTGCQNGACTALTDETCGGTPAVVCQLSSDECHDTGSGSKCLRRAGISCSTGSDCISGGCSGSVGSEVCDALTEEKCLASNSGAVCKAATDTCSGTSPNQTCLRDAGVTCTKGTQCISGACGSNSVCTALTREMCGADNKAAICTYEDTTDDCRASYSDPTGKTYCLRAVGVTCTGNGDCWSGGCANDVCKAVTEETCSATVLCQVAGDTCSDTGAGKKCLRPVNTACTAGTQCISGGCANGVCQARTGETCGGSPDVTCVAATDTCEDTGAGKVCLRAVAKTCTEDAQCISGSCQDAVSPATGKVCAALVGETCEAANNGAACKAGEGTCRLAFGETAGDTRCRRDAGKDCTAGTDCLSGGCANGVCKALDGEECGGTPTVACLNAPDATCTTYADNTPPGTFCLRVSGKTCAAGPGTITANQTCVSEVCAAAASGGSGNVCAALVGELCGEDNGYAVCKTGAGTCRAAYSTPTGDVRCLRDAGAACTAGTDCYSGGCANGVCKAVTGETCGGTPEVTCQVSGDVCHDSGTAKTCLRPAGVTCTDGAQCVSGGCSGSVGSKVCDARTEEKCGTSNSGAVCKAATDTCSGTSPNQTCLRDAGVTCTTGTQCISAECATAVSPATGSVCKALAGQTCEAANNGATCKEAASDCRLAFGAASGSTRCRRDGGESCTTDDQCYSGSCASGVCKALDGEACGTSNNSAVCLNAPNAACTTYAVGTPLGNYCLRAVGGTCAAGPGTITANDTCASKVCDNATCVACTLDTHCPSATPVCDATTKTCVACTSTNIGACTGSTPVCGAANTCVQCTATASSYCGTGTAAGKPVCDTTTSTCVQCSAGNTSACTGTTPVCNTATGSCVQCDATNKTACTGSTPVCDTANYTCVQCLATSDCDSLSAGGCTLYACSGAKTCVANGTKPVNSTCSTGYCNASGTCVATPACTFTRAECSNNNATCGTLLRDTLNGAVDGAVIGIPSGTYTMPSTITMDRFQNSQFRTLTLVKCETTNPVMDGGWGGVGTTSGRSLFSIGDARLTIDGVNLTNGYNTGWGGAIALATNPSRLDPVPFISLKNMTITNSKALQGGALNAVVQVTMDNVQISGCKSERPGGAVYVATEIGTGLTLNNVSMTGNQAGLTVATPLFQGAGLYINDSNNGDGVTCTGTNSINNGTNGNAPIYDCAYDASIPKKFDPANFAGCGCNTTEPKPA